MAETIVQRVTEGVRARGVELHPTNAAKGFSQFLKQYGVLPLAIGVVMGTAINDFVKAIVAGLITPLISLVSPGGKLQKLTLTFHDTVFSIGMVLDAFLTFLAIALVVYLIAKIILRDEDLLGKK